MNDAATKKKKMTKMTECDPINKLQLAEECEVMFHVWNKSHNKQQQ